MLVTAFWLMSFFDLSSGRGIQPRVERDRRPVEQLQAVDVRIEPARDAADRERARDERQVEPPRRHVGEQSRPGPQRILQPEAAADDGAVEHARDEIALDAQHAVAIGEPRECRPRAARRAPASRTPG